MQLKFKMLQLCLASLPVLGSADSKIWESEISGNSWNYADHWANSEPPGPSDVAVFNTLNPFPLKKFMISVIAPIQIQGLEFSNQNPETFYHLFGKTPIQLSKSPFITVHEGNQTITKLDVPLLVTENLKIQNASEKPLLLEGAISGKAKTIALHGPGVIEIGGEESNTFLGNLEIHGTDVSLNKKNKQVAVPSTVHVFSGNLKTLKNHQFSENASVFLEKGTTLDLGSNQEVLQNLHLKSKLFMGQEGSLLVHDTAHLYDGSAINGDGSLSLQGMLIAHGPTSIQTPIDLAQGQRTISVQTPILFLDREIENGSLVKTGEGTLILNGENTYAGGTLVQEGTLQASTKTLPQDAQIQGTLQLHQNFDGKIQGSLSGEGKLLKTGTGIIHLNQENPFVGKILLQEGFLQTTTRSTGGQIVCDGTLIFDQNFEGSFEKKLAGSGTVIKQGSSKISLEGENPFYGKMHIVSGEIEGSTKSLQAHLVNDALVTLNQDFSGTYASPIDGQGTVVKTGKGPLQLNKQGNFSGSFNLTQGELFFGNGQALGTATIKLENDTAISLGPNISVPNAISFDDTASFGVPAGTAFLTGEINGKRVSKKGNGSLGLCGNVDIEGLNLEMGTIEVHGKMKTKAPIVVEPQTRLVGTGKIQANLDLQGTLTGGKILPGETPFDMDELFDRFSFEKPVEEEVPPSDDLYLVGDYSSRTVSGKVNIEGDVSVSDAGTILAHFSPNSFSQVQIDGTLTLSESTLQLEPSAGTYHLGKTYKILQAPQIDGEFGQVINPFPMINPIISYNKHEGSVSVFFELGAYQFKDLFSTGNVGQVARCLDFMATNPCENSATVISSLMNTSPEPKLHDALDSLQPSLFTSLSVVQENDLFYTRNAIFERLKSSQKGCLNQPKDGSLPISFWGSFVGGYTTQENQGGDPGYLARSPGVVLGVDAEVKDGTTVGGGLGYIYTRHEWKQSRGDANIHNIYASVYGQYSGDRGFVIASLLGGYGFYDVERKFAFGPFDATRGTAKSSFGGADGAIDLKTGLRFAFDRLSVLPFVALDYMLVHQNSFTEKNARSLNLKVKSHLADLFTSEGGVELDFCQQKDDTYLKAFLRFSAIVESRFFGDKEEASFACSGCPMDVYGFYPTRVLACLGMGLNATFGRNTFSAAYQAKSQWKFTDQSLFFQYLWMF